MSISINYNKKNTNKLSLTEVLFVRENFSITNLKKHISRSEYLILSDLIKTLDLKKKIVSFDLNSKRKIILISLGDNLKNSSSEKLGAEFFTFIKNFKQQGHIINSDTLPKNFNNFIGDFLHGLKLKSYSFDKYKTKKMIKKSLFW